MAAKSGKFRESRPSRTSLFGTTTKPRNRPKTNEDETDQSSSFKVYSVLSLEDATELIDADLEDIEKKLIGILQLHDPTTSLTDGLVLDYFMEGVIWARDHEFNPPKLSGFFTVLHELLENIKDKHLKFQENIKHFRGYYSGIGLTGGQQIAGTDLFNIKEAKNIISYFCTTLFQHYALYEFVFSNTQAEEIIGTQLKIETPKSQDKDTFPPLMEGASQPMFEKYKDISLNSIESETVYAPIKDTLMPTEEEFELFQQLTKTDVEEVFSGVFSDALLDVEPEISAPLQEKEEDIKNRIMHLCGFED